MNRFEPCHTTRLLKQIFRQKLCPSSGKKIQGMKIGERQWWKKREITKWGKRMGEKPVMNWGKDEAREYNWEREKKRLIGNDSIRVHNESIWTMSYNEANFQTETLSRGGHPDWVIPDQPFLLSLSIVFPSLIFPSVHPRFLTHPLPPCYYLSLLPPLSLSVFHSLYRFAWWRTEFLSENLLQ